MSFLLAWQAAAVGIGRSYLLPTPLAVVAAFVTELTATATLPLGLGIEVPATRMVAKLVQSLFHCVPGLAVGSTLGISLGVAMGWNETLEDALTPATRVLRPIPPLAWIAFAIV